MTYSPLMGVYLTYLDSASLESSRRYPDENYAREVMQLFSIGLHKLHADGTHVTDANGERIPTYTNDDIMDLARAFTGFDEQSVRTNIEAANGYNNYVDPMQLKPERRDIFPKMGLDGAFIGDGYPLCGAMPAGAFLRAGAKYRLVGPSLSAHNHNEPLQPGLHLDAHASSLHAVLCGPEPSDGGRCTFAQHVVLAESLPCHAAECDVHSVPTVSVTGADGVVMHYEYVRPACVSLAFASDGVTVKERYKTLCVDGRSAAAGVGCCDEESSTRAVGRCAHERERVPYAMAEARCAAEGLALCRPYPTWSLYVDECDYQGHTYAWTASPCTIRVQVAPTGRVNMVHTPERSRDALGVDAPMLVRVGWEGGVYPTAAANCSAAGDVCEVRADTCLCETAVQTGAVFTDSLAVPSKEEVLAQLHIGSPPPELFAAGTYSLCTTAPCYAATGVEVYTTSAGSFDEQTIFRIAVDGEHVYLANLASVVRIGAAGGGAGNSSASQGSYAFRNPPAFMDPLGSTARDAADEIEAVIDHIFHHPNTAPFIARSLIQRLVTSNPSPRYVHAAATAFRTGTCGGRSYSGAYGDLGALVAAIYLDAEARSEVLDLDPTHGQLREPLLKVLHFMRSMELEPTRNSEFELDEMKRKVGMQVYQSPTVFNFYTPDFQPSGAVELAGLYSPESQLLVTPLLLSFLNGMSSLVQYGLTTCVDGFGTTAGREDCGAVEYGGHRIDGLLGYEPPSDDAAAVVDELSLLLTGGRLGGTSRGVIMAAYDEALRAHSAGAALQVAQELMVVSAEFHATNLNVLLPTLRAVETDVDASERGYKAIVMLYMSGGCDTYNVLVPYGGCGEFDLYADYEAVRSNLALERSDLLPIDVQAGTQPCEQFGIHEELTVVKALYDAGEAAFVANIGPLIEPVTKEQYLSRDSGVRLPPSLYSHNDQTRAWQTAIAQELTGHGVLGRIVDTLLSQPSAYKVGSYSIDGTAKVLQGIYPATIIDENDGVVRYAAYNRLAHYIDNMTKYESASIFGETFNHKLQESLRVSESLGSTLDGIELSQAFSTDRLSKQLKQVARLVKTRELVQTEREVFYVSIGGFDMHNELYYALKDRLAEINGALRSFVAEMQDLGVWDDVVVLSSSEFARTLTSNGRGSDHAWGGNHFVLGGSISGGQILGDFPSVLNADGEQILDRGRVIPTTSLEALWSPLADWFGVEADRMDELLPNRPNFAADALFSTRQLFRASPPPPGSPLLPPQPPTLPQSPLPQLPPSPSPSAPPLEPPLSSPQPSMPPSSPPPWLLAAGPAMLAR